MSRPGGEVGGGVRSSEASVPSVGCTHFRLLDHRRLCSLCSYMCVTIGNIPYIIRRFISIFHMFLYRSELYLIKYLYKL